MPLGWLASVKWDSAVVFPDPVFLVCLALIVLRLLFKKHLRRAVGLLVFELALSVAAVPNLPRHPVALEANDKDQWGNASTFRDPLTGEIIGGDHVWSQMETGKLFRYPDYPGEKRAAATVLILAWVAWLCLAAVPVLWVLAELRLWLPRSPAEQRKQNEARAFIAEAIRVEKSPDFKIGAVNGAWWEQRGRKNPALERSGLLETAPGAIPLGFACTGEPLQDGGETHLVTIGPSGTGKNTSSQTPALLTYPGSCFVIDPKGQLAAITTKRRQALGQETANLNPFDVLGLPTACYNPLRFLDPASLSFTSDCRRIASGLVYGDKTESSKNDHFDTSALALVTLVIQWIVLYGDTEVEREPKDLISVRSIVNKLGDEKQRVVFFETMQGCDAPLLAESAGRWLSKQGEVNDCISTAQNHISFMADAGIGRVLRNTGGAQEISFADMKRRGLTVFVQIPPDLLETHGRFLRLLVMSALAELIKEQTNPEHRVLFMLDEFAQLGRMKLIEKTAAIVRDYKVRLWLILQNLPQLQDIYGKLGAESFLSSAGVVQVFAPNEETTAEFISKRSGEMFEESTSKNTTRGTSTSGSSTSESESKAERERRVVLPQHTRALPKLTGQYLMVPGLDTVIQATRKQYWDLFSKDVYEPDPYHMTPKDRAEWDAELAGGDTYFHHGRGAVKP